MAQYGTTFLHGHVLLNVQHPTSPLSTPHLACADTSQLLLLPFAPPRTSPPLCMLFTTTCWPPLPCANGPLAVHSPVLRCLPSAAGAAAAGKASCAVRNLLWGSLVGGSGWLQQTLQAGPPTASLPFSPLGAQARNVLVLPAPAPCTVWPIPYWLTLRLPHACMMDLRATTLRHCPLLTHVRLVGIVSLNAQIGHGARQCTCS